MEYKAEWFNHLLVANDVVKTERITMMPFLAVPTPVVDLIFSNCALFNQAEEVRYLSVELFDRFVRLNFRSLFETVWCKERSLASEQWQNVEIKLHSQTTLRILSCIQLASKFILHTNVLKPKQIQSYLQAEGKAYTLRMILSSEMRVWRTLNFHINIPTVKTLVDFILDKLRCVLPYSNFIDNNILRQATLFTDFVYLHHQEIYHKLFYFSTGRCEATLQEKKDFLCIECNLLYKAVAVAVLSITFTFPELEVDIYEHVGFITNLSPKDIQALVIVISQLIFS